MSSSQREAERPSGQVPGRASGRSWPDLDGLPGVAESVESARSAIASVQRLPVNRRNWHRTAAAATVRAARASAMLDGGSAIVVGDGATAGQVDDPVLAGAVRAYAAIGELAATWPRAPLQALARLHVLAAADLAPQDALGRPRPADGVTERLTALADAVTDAPWSGPVMTAIVHGELMAVRPFGTADGVVARAAARLVMVATGLDPQALTVPEVGHLRAGEAYRSACANFASGEPAAVAEWITSVCGALRVGAREAGSIARAAGAAPPTDDAADPT